MPILWYIYLSQNSFFPLLEVLMETNVKEVPSKDVAVSAGSFLVGSLYIAGLALGVMFALWGMKIGADFEHVVGYGSAIVMFARLGVWITAREPDPACSVFVSNLMLACLVASSLDAYTKRSQIPYLDIVLCVLLIIVAIKDIRRASIMMRHAVPVLMIQHLVLGAGLYVLYFKF